MPIEALGGILRDLGVPYEATSPVVLVPPLTIDLLPTTQPLTARAIATAAALLVHFVGME